MSSEGQKQDPCGNPLTDNAENNASSSSVVVPPPRATSLMEKRMPFWRHKMEAIKRKEHFSWATVADRVRKKKLVPKPKEGAPDADAAAVVVKKTEDGKECVEVETEEFEDEPWQTTLLRLLLSWEFEIFLLVLLAGDVILLIVELELQTKKVCHIVWDAAGGNVVTGTALGTVNCANAPTMTLSCEDTRRFQLNAPYSVCPFVVTEELPHAIHTAEVGVGWASRSIIIAFGLELILLLIAAGPAIFTAHKLYLLDAVIIFVSILMDILTATLDLDHIVEVIVVIRVWRFARIVHGVGVSVHDVDEHEHDEHHSDHLIAATTNGSPSKHTDEEKNKKGGADEEEKKKNEKGGADGDDKAKEKDDNKQEATSKDEKPADEEVKKS